MKPGKKNSYNCLKSIAIDGKSYKFYSLKEAEKNGLDGISKLPKSLIAKTFISVSPFSKSALKTNLPILPKPLIPIFNNFFLLLNI